MTEPEKLVENIAEKLYLQFKPHTSGGHCDCVAKDVLRIVLSEIQKGGVVEITDRGWLENEYVCSLKPEFQKFLEEK